MSLQCDPSSQSDTVSSERQTGVLSDVVWSQRQFLLNLSFAQINVFNMCAQCQQRLQIHTQSHTLGAAQYNQLYHWSKGRLKLITHTHTLLQYILYMQRTARRNMAVHNVFKWNINMCREHAIFKHGIWGYLFKCQKHLTAERFIWKFLVVKAAACPQMWLEEQ